MNLEQILQNAEITEFQDGDILYVVRPGAGAQDRAIKPESIGILKSLHKVHGVWAQTEAYTVTGNAVYDADGIIESADIEWPDGVSGTISNVETDDFGISSIRFNRSGSRYITIAITRNEDGHITQTSVTPTGY